MNERLESKLQFEIFSFNEENIQKMGGYGKADCDQKEKEKKRNPN